MTHVQRAIASQSILSNGFATGFEAGLKQVAAERLIQRLWSKDATLWTANPAEQQHIANRLGWLSIASVMESQVDRIQAAAREIREAGFTHALLLGMGGSSLFSEVCRRTFGVASGWLDLQVLDSTDPAAIESAQRRAPLEHTLLIVSSKSGSTTEVSALCEYFYDQLRRIKGDRAGGPDAQRRGGEEVSHSAGSATDRAGEHFIAITDAGTSLEMLAKQRGFRHAFVHGPSTGQDVGGRFSALTAFGLVPAALMGIDIRQLLARANAMLLTCQAAVPLAENPSAQLAILLAEAAKAGRDKITLLSAKPLASFGTWVEQLIAESTGKSGKGLIPIYGEPVMEPGAYGPDRVFVELQLETERDASLRRLVDALGQLNHPIVRLQWRDRYDLGGEAMRWFLVTAVVASLMRMNAFDEPNVQESKDRTKALLERYAKDGALPSEEPLVREAELVVYGTGGVHRPSSVDEAIRRFLSQSRPGDYFAVLSFLPRIPALDAAIEQLRDALATRSGLAVMLGYGPRYLHSTGQLHKGGPDRAVLLFFTGDDTIQLSVPGKPYTFSVLKQAQALGDFEALRERNRRILRLHLGQSPEAGLSRVRTIIEQAFPNSGSRRTAAV